MKEYQINKTILEKEKKELEEKISNIEQQKNKTKEKATIENKKRIYEILLDPNIEELEKYQIAHKLFNKIEFNKNNNELELYYN